ncbi:hypothetical protein Enr13x_62330 [Stieleria neptunia]|uniref:HEAT repeat protein n=1 Tax=Stieleria neptunia TaxID=2527979 RepID=A0A518I000_9BACT|nr:hypothetical protein [Stieleria neptunia]QDV46324.1 hypothetical protein Enr13x_62330 [Stieleria neptunia]
MNPDKLDQLIRGSDPADAPNRSDSVDPLLDQFEQQWSVLSRRRVVLRKRLTLCLAAIGLFAILGGSAMWVQMHPRQNDAHFAVVTAADSTTDRAPKNLADAAPRQRRPSPIVVPNEPKAEADMVSPSQSPRPTGKLADSVPPRPKPVPAPAKLARPTARPSQPVIDHAEQLAELAAFVDRAGKVDSNTWRQSCDYLARQDPRSQRTVIMLVPQLADPQQKKKAFDLVCAAAADSQRTVLLHWLSHPSLRAMAFERLAAEATLEQTIELIQRAQNDPERTLLCRQLAASPDSQSVEVLLELAHNARWRAAIGSASRELNPSHIQTLIMRMRDRNAPVRTAAAFVLASVPGEQLDQVLASMILRGRFRQPAYLVLLSRNTPQARAFLAQAASRQDLTPALVSARMHFANIQPTLQQWIADSKGTPHERSDTSQQRFTDALDSYRCARRADTRNDIG